MTARLVLQNLILNKSFSSKANPYIKAEYFESIPEKTIYGIFSRYVSKYSSLPTIDILKAELQHEKISFDAKSECEELLTKMTRDYQTPDEQYLLDTTESWCRYSACKIAVHRAINIITDKGNKPLSALPELFNEALSVNFDTNLGHDYYSMIDDRIEKLQEDTSGIPCGLNFIDDCLGGGFAKGTLTIFVAGTGGGKSLMKSHLCAEMYKRGYNCLYCTLEMSDVKIGQRLDANITCIPINQLQAMDKNDYKQAILNATSDKRGRCIILDYPPQSISVSHLRNVLNDLESKSNFVPDFIFVDYLNLMRSSRVNSNENSYMILKSVTEELFGLAKERGCSIISSTQLNRGGYDKSGDPGLENVSDSMGISFGTDSMFALYTDEILRQQNIVRIKCLKTRFSDKTNWTSKLAVDWARMKFINPLDDDSFVQPMMPKAVNTTSSQKPNTKALSPKKKFGDITI